MSHIGMTTLACILSDIIFSLIVLAALLSIFNTVKIISSPEHEVLMVSYCDLSMFVVRCPSCVVNNLF